MLNLYKLKNERTGPVPDEEVFYGLLGEATLAAHPYTEGDPVGVFVSLAAAVAAIIGRDPYVKVGNQRHPLLFWPVLAGRTALGRKGTATGAAMEIFERACNYLYPDDSKSFMESNVLPGAPSSGAAIVSEIESMARNAEWFEPTESDDEDEPKVLMDGFPCLMLEEEWAGPMRTSRMDKDMGKIMRLAWQGNTLSSMVKNKKDRAEVKKSHMGVIGHVTPDEFRACLSASDVAGGSYNRLFVVYVHRCQSLPLADEVPGHIIDSLARRIKDAILFAQQCGQIKLGKDAREYWVSEMYESLNQLSTKTKLTEAFAGRALPYVMRISGLLALMDKKTEISVAHLRAAEKLVEYMIKSVQFIMESTQTHDKSEVVDIQGDPLRARKEVMNVIKAVLIPAGDEGVTGTVLLNRVRNKILGTKTQAIQDAILALNGDVKKLRLAQEGAAGRKTEKYIWVGSREDRLDDAEEAEHDAAIDAKQSKPRRRSQATSGPPKAVQTAAPRLAVKAPAPKPSIKPAPKGRFGGF